MYFFTCRLLGYVSHRGVIKPSPCLKNKNGKVKDEITTALFFFVGGGGGGGGDGAVSFSFEVCIFLVLHPASKLGTNESGVS